MAIPGDRKVDGPELGLQAASLALLTHAAARTAGQWPPRVSPKTLSRLMLGTWTLHA